MATKDVLSKEELKKTKEIFQSYVKLSSKAANPNQVTSKAIGKLAKDCWKDLVLFIDTVGFPKCKEPGKPYMLVSDEKLNEFVGRCAGKMRELGKTPKTHDCWEKELVEMLKSAQLTAATKTSKTGNVDHFTDTKAYTGTHKERFDVGGKGKGKKGREDVHSGDGYVQAYSDKGTYDEKH